MRTSTRPAPQNLDRQRPSAPPSHRITSVDAHHENTICQTRRSAPAPATAKTRRTNAGAYTDGRLEERPDTLEDELRLVLALLLLEQFRQVQIELRVLPCQLPFHAGDGRGRTGSASSKSSCSDVDVDSGAPSATVSSSVGGVGGSSSQTGARLKKFGIKADWMLARVAVVETDWSSTSSCDRFHISFWSFHLYSQYSRHRPPVQRGVVRLSRPPQPSSPPPTSRVACQSPSDCLAAPRRPLR